MDNAYNKMKATGILNPLETAFADMIGELDPDGGQAVQLCAALAMRACRNGNVCLDLYDIRGTAHLPGEIRVPEPEQLLQSLQQSHLVGRLNEFKPLVLADEQRLYLQRYWDYEQRLAKVLLRLAAGQPDEFNKELAVSTLNRLFAADSLVPDWQKIAAAMVLYKRLVIISGGPGTGKTTTVVKIMALLQELAGGDLRIGLAAPTGKAVARLTDTVQTVKKSLPVSSTVRDAIPDKAVTIHRLLGARRHSPYFKHTSENPLHLDVLIVDEASMVDLALMCKLVEALPEHGRLVLLGDKDQLASVEAGRIMGDICATESSFSEDFADCLAEMEIQLDTTGGNGHHNPLQDTIVLLENNYRFEVTGGIGCLSKAIRMGDAERAMSCLVGDNMSGVHFHQYSDNWQEKFSEYIEGFKGIFAAVDPGEALTCYNGFRVLCVHRFGTLGVREMNRRVEQILRNEGCISTAGEWYHGRPVMISRNDYDLGLFNGDTGIAMVDAGGRMRVCFSGADMISVAPSRLQHYETAYCMTVHKSQGSEFDRVALFLPEKHSTLLTRELLYTAISRARKEISLWGSNDILQDAISTQVSRSSGLRQLLENEK